jgi:hypothetical protein
LLATLVIKPKGKAKARLRSTRRSKLKLKVAYTPTGGATLRKTKSLTLRLAGH